MEFKEGQLVYIITRMVITGLSKASFGASLAVVGEQINGADDEFYRVYPAQFIKGTLRIEKSKQHMYVKRSELIPINYNETEPEIYFSREIDKKSRAAEKALMYLQSYYPSLDSEPDLKKTGLKTNKMEIKKGI